jgi:hypothetical protein
MKSFWRALNSEQRSLAGKPVLLLGMYLNSAWRQLAVAPLAAILIVLGIIGFTGDHAIAAGLRSSQFYKHLSADVVAVLQHRRLVLIALCLICALTLPPFVGFSIRLLRSWKCGLWQAAPTALVFLTFGFYVFCPYRIKTLTLLIFLFFISDFGLFCRSKLKKLGDLSPAGILLRRTTKPKPLLRKRSKADAISEWNQDRLQRSSLVDTLKVQLLIGEVPVIALRGKFGEGKSSVLNLLRDDLKPHAIVVSFSSWLPGSEATLTNELFHDIAKECRKRYYIPGLRKAFTRYAAIFSADIPYLKGIREIFQPPTQRQELEEMKELLNALPEKIIVLLDEIDRMRRKELLTLMKLIRGTGAVPNLSFVCAFDREQVEKTVCKSYDAESHEYFEKFFPHAIDLPAVSSSVLKAEFLCALVKPQENTEGEAS